MRLIESMTLVALGFMVAISNADTIYVCWDGSGDYVTIQEGIDAASDGDEVVVCDGTYTGEGNKNLDFLGKAITVRSANGPENCIIDCEYSGRGFYFHSGETQTSVLDGITIRNGYAERGSAVCCPDDSSPTITNCIIAANEAYGSGDYGGGGVYCRGGGCPTFSNCIITGNTGDGAGVFCYTGGNPTFADCAITTNTGTGITCKGSSPTFAACAITGNASLGVLGFCSNMTVVDCTISENTHGGMAFTEDSLPTVTKCVISGNWGGGISSGHYSDPLVTDCTIIGNSGSYGGGVSSAGGYTPTMLTVRNCIIVGNTANHGGGGFCAGGGASFANCLITGNMAARGAALYLGEAAFPEAHVDCANCTITGNKATEDGGGVFLEGAYCFATFHNCILWGDSPQEISDKAGEANASFSDVEGGWPGEGNIDADPRFVDPENNDYHLRLCSPCIDAADNEAVPPDWFDLDGDGDTEEPIPYDLDGKPRFVDDPNVDDTGNGDPPIVDMGAYEFQADCPGDLDCDRDVDHADLGILLACWGCDCGDLNCDGHTDQADLGILLAHWGQECP